MKTPIILVKQIAPILLFNVFALALHACKDKIADIEEPITITLDPTDEQLNRYRYFSERRGDSIRVTEYPGARESYLNFSQPQKGSVIHSKCLKKSKDGLCTYTVNYYKIVVASLSSPYSRFNYFITYDYIHDSLEFQMPVWGYVKIALKDFRDPNAKTYIGNYTLNNKTYTHVHKCQVNNYFEAYVNDSVGLIYYNHGGVYITELF
ncbi:MAG: hypothetical protein MUE96_06600 [Bacteroidia bacterium]|jgi:hypothetical protein|nr:hypothetical protein [Bacteroidia bacterium]